MFVIIGKMGNTKIFIASNKEALPDEDRCRRMEMGLGSHGTVLDTGDGKPGVGVLDDGYKWKVI